MHSTHTQTPATHDGCPASDKLLCKIQQPKVCPRHQGDGDGKGGRKMRHVGEGVWTSVVAWKGWLANEETARHVGQCYPVFMCDQFEVSSMYSPVHTAVLPSSVLLYLCTTIASSYALQC